jgi:hypothetical protein
MSEERPSETEAGFSTFSVESQLAALRAWESRTGQTSSTAERILLDLEIPMTKREFVVTENPGWDHLDVLADPDWIEMFPDFFMTLPDGPGD